MMASFTLMKPTILRKGRKPKRNEDETEVKKERKPLTQYEMSVKMKQKLREFLSDTDRMPKVLIFLTRNMRMVQGKLAISDFRYFTMPVLTANTFLDLQVTISPLALQSIGLKSLDSGPFVP